VTHPEEMTALGATGAHYKNCFTFDSKVSYFYLQWNYIIIIILKPTVEYLHTTKNSQVETGPFYTSGDQGSVSTAIPGQ